MSNIDTVEQIKSTLQNAGFDNASVEKIMDKFIVADKNLILKTDIENSVAFTKLMVIKADLQSKGLKKSAKTLEVFIDSYIKVRVSHKRKSRHEILDAISAIKRETGNSAIGKWLGLGNTDKKGD